MSAKSILTIALFYLINGPFCDFLEVFGVAGPWIGFIDYTLLFVIILALHFPRIKEAFSDLKDKEQAPYRFLLETAAIMVLSFLLTNLLVYLFGNFLNLDILPQNTENLKENTAELPKLLTFLMMAIYAPIIEETVFRESFIGWPEKSDSSAITLMTLISIVSFDFIHVIQVHEFLYYLPLSIGLTLVYRRNDRNLASSITAHMLTNTVAFILILVGGL